MTTPAKVKWVWVDLDDTLVDFHANSNDALLRCYREWHLDTYYNSEQEWLDSYHAHNSALWAEYNTGAITQSFLRMERFRRPLTDAGMTDDNARRASAELDPVYLDYLARGKRLIPGAIELLTALRERGYHTGILSNGFNGVQQLKVESCGLNPLIDLIVLSDEIGINKPDVRLYHYAMERSGESQPSAHMMIGDNPATDIAGAINAGWHAMLFDPRGEFRDCSAPTLLRLTDALAVL